MQGTESVTVTIAGKSETILLAHFAPILTSHSLALHEWEKKAVEKARESITAHSLTEAAKAIYSPETQIGFARDTIRDVNERRETIAKLEALFKA